MAKNRRVRGAAPWHLTLYSRAGCHLCEDAARALATLVLPMRLEVTEVDIEADHTLLAEYAIRIPVLVDSDTGVVLAEGNFDRAALRASLRRFSRSR